jgi:hypothetical protein
LSVVSSQDFSSLSSVNLTTDLSCHAFESRLLICINADGTLWRSRLEGAPIGRHQGGSGAPFSPLSSISLD